MRGFIGVLGGTVCLLTALAASARAANPACTWYVSQSVRQQQDNVQRACGFRGPEWSSDVKAHGVYCEGQAPQDAKALIQKRQQMLDDCAKASKK
jgi:hypothetical protein